MDSHKGARGWPTSASFARQLENLALSYVGLAEEGDENSRTDV
jgi:hypothetical protein